MADRNQDRVMEAVRVHVERQQIPQLTTLARWAGVEEFRGNGLLPAAPPKARKQRSRLRLLSA